MPTNANTFNSRVTSEALEAKYREVFPSQGGAELPQDLFASGVIQPVVDFSNVAEGSVLPVNLQTAWDFSTGHDEIVNTTTTMITNTGFWQVDLVASINSNSAAIRNAEIYINSGITTKTVWKYAVSPVATEYEPVAEGKFVVFLRSGDSLVGTTNGSGSRMNVWYRQIADINGNLVNPLGFTFS